MAALEKLYNISGVSRTEVAEYLGYDFAEQADKLEEENVLIEEKGLSAFGQQPFSRPPEGGGEAPQPTQTTTKKQPKTPADKTKTG